MACLGLYLQYIVSNFFIDKGYVMRPTLRQLQYLVEVADCGRFGVAADRLHISQPSLSAQIAEAETDLACACSTGVVMGPR